MVDKGVRDLVKDHKQLFKTFPKTLNGEDLVNFLISNAIAKDVPEAINTAQQLINFDLLVPVTDKSSFKVQARPFSVLIFILVLVLVLISSPLHLFQPFRSFFFYSRPSRSICIDCTKTTRRSP